MGPNVGAVVVHKNGDVANNPNRFLDAVATHRTPLLPEKELHSAADGQFCLELLARGVDGLRLASRQVHGPQVPVLSMTLAERIKQNVIFEPPGIFFTKLVEAPARIAGRA